MKTQFDICIVGAGMAGATIAAYLAPKGVNIALIDRGFTEKKRIVGELLQPGAVLTMKQMGLGHLLEGFDAQEVFGYALLKGNEQFAIPYNDSQSAHFNGLGLHNGRFLQKIRGYALDQKTVTPLQGTALNLIEDDHGVVKGVNYKDKATGEIIQINAQLTVSSDGFFSNFRKYLTRNNKSVTSYFIGLILTDCELPFPHHGHVFLSGPTPFICYPISSNEVRVLIDFPGEIAPKKTAIKDHLKNNVEPFIPECMKHNFASALQDDKFKVMPNHYMAAKPIVKKGAVMLGDSLNMRHPLTGGGLTAVFSDVQLLSNHLLEMHDFSNLDLIHRKVELYYRDRKHANANVNILANALYGVMSNDLLKNAVFNYIKKGGQNAQIPITILAGLDKNQKTLIRHFFSVALFGATDLIRESAMNFPKAAKVLLDAVKIIKPLARNEISLASIFSANSSK